MQPLLPWILLGFILLMAFPWAVLLTRSVSHPANLILTLVVTLALSVGALTLLMFWLAWLGFRLTAPGVTLAYIVLMIPGWLLWWHTIARGRPVTPRIRSTRSRLEWIALAILLSISAAILFNAVYWPFSKADTLGIYARYGRLMYETGMLVPFAGRDDAFYQAYPILVPLAYTYAYFISGWVNEYLARLIPALLSLGCLPAAYILGRTLFGSLTGWLSALLLALTPTFARWASSGYVDLPMAFFYTLAAVFSYRLWESQNWRDALLCGVMIGLAAWTKNAALLGLGFLSLWLLYGLLTRRITPNMVLMTLAAGTAIAAPWYARNWLETRLIVPPTAWTEQAAPTLSNLLILITLPDNFSLSGWIMLAGLITALIRVMISRYNSSRMWFLILLTLPFLLTWWLLVSYDPRFILLFLPLLAVLGSYWLANLWHRLPGTTQKRLVIPLLVLALILAVYSIWISVEFKDEILRNPLMTDAEKHDLVLQGLQSNQR